MTAGGTDTLETRSYERERRWDAMTRDERLLEYVRTNDPRLCTRLLKEHDGIARSVARRYAAVSSSPEDIYQVARIGLMNAIRRFNPDRGSFVSFAFRTVRGDVQRHLRDTAWPVSARRSAREGYLLVRDEADLLTQTLGRPPTPEEIASSVGATAEAVRGWQHVAAAAATSPLEDSAGESVEPAAVDEDRAYAEVETRMVVESMLQRMPPRDQQILRLRYFRELSQREIAGIVGLSQMQVSRSLKASVELARQRAPEVAAEAVR